MRNGAPCLEVGNMQNKKQSNATYIWADMAPFLREQPI